MPDAPLNISDQPNSCLAPAIEKETKPVHWYVLRDLKRANAKLNGFKLLSELGFEVFTPTKVVVKVVKGHRKRVQVPVLSDLLFAHTDKDSLIDIMKQMPTLQFRYIKGGYCKPMIVRDMDMERFIRAVTMAADPKYFAPEEFSHLSVGRDIKIIAGVMQGVEGKIVNVRGAKKKRIMVSIPGLIAAVVEIEPEFIQFIDDK